MYANGIFTEDCQHFKSLRFFMCQIGRNVKIMDVF